MKRLLILLLYCCPYFLFAQNHAPVVSNVQVSQRIDCSHMVDIHYDVHDPDGDAMTVSIQVSNDNGSTWNFSVSSSSLTGDIGPGITSGSNKHIIWNFAQDHANVVVPNVRIKVIADDGVVPGGTCGSTLTDTRDGQQYPTVQIGTQCWMAKNLNIGAMVSGSSNQTNNSTIEKYCYNNDANNCAIYGGLYQWNEMMNYTTTPGTQGICPTGWHIPTDAEWCTLTTFLDATVNCNTWGWSGTNAGGKMKATGTTHWSSPNTGATNSSGFTALGAGRRDNNGTFYGLRYYAHFWSSSKFFLTHGVYRYLLYDYASVIRDLWDQRLGFSVRCLRN